MGNPAARFLDEMIEHRPGSFKVRHDAVYQRCNDDYVAGFAALHLARFVTDRYRFAAKLVDSDHRWLVNHNAPAAYRDNCARRTHVNGHRIRHQIAQRAEPHERTRFAHERHSGLKMSKVNSEWTERRCPYAIHHL